MPGIDSVSLITIGLFILGGAVVYAAFTSFLYRIVGKRWLERWVERRLLAERTEMNRKLEEMAESLERPSERQVRFPGKEEETLVETWKRLQAALRAAHGYSSYRNTQSLLYYDPQKQSNGTEKKLQERKKAMIDAYTDFREYFICSSNFLTTEAYLQIQGFVFDLGMYITSLVESSDQEFAAIRRDLDELQASKEVLVSGFIRTRIGYLIE